MQPTTLRSPLVGRRSFLRTVAVGAGVLAGVPAARPNETPNNASAAMDYRGPNVFIIRWGGGARRRESIDPSHTLTPFLCHELRRRGVLYPRMEIEQFQDYQTSHGEGTLYILTGKFARFRDIHETRGANRKFLGARFEAEVPTLFEYFRQTYAVPEHQALLINGEDRGDEEFYNFSNHHLFGVQYRSQTLSLRRYKTWLLRRQIAEGRFEGRTLAERTRQLEELESLDYRAIRTGSMEGALDGFWERWRAHYGETGLINPRGDRLLTELTLRATRELQPRLVMVNYQDCDYVHWGYADHYTRGLTIMDEEVRKLVTQVEADPFYRDHTVWVVVPDCGRDDNPFMAVPFQHHFNSRSSHEIFALMFGAGVPAGKVVERKVSQTQLAATVGKIMGFPTPHAESAVLEEVFA